MVEIISSLTSSCQPDVDHMISSWDKTYHTCHKENCTLKPIFRLSYCVSTHAKEAYSYKKEYDSCTNCFPVLPDFGMIPAIHGLCSFHILMYEGIWISRCRVFSTLVSFAAEKMKSLIIIQHETLFVQYWIMYKIINMQNGMVSANLIHNTA